MAAITIAIYDGTAQSTGSFFFEKLDFDRNASLETLAREYDEQMKYVSSRAKEQLGLSAILIRPDGFVAWASDNDEDYNELRETLAGLFVIQGIKH